MPLSGKGAIDLMALKKQEEARRKKIPKSKQAITDANVNTITSGGKSYGFVQMESEAPLAEENISEVSNSENQSAEAKPSEVSTSENKSTETKQSDFWKKQQVELETRIADLKQGIEDEQDELNKLWSDFYIKNIPAEQDAIKVQISQLTNQSEQKKLFLNQAEVELAEFYEKARKAGIPPGWLR